MNEVIGGSYDGGSYAGLRHLPTPPPPRASKPERATARPRQSMPDTVTSRHAAAGNAQLPRETARNNGTNNWQPASRRPVTQLLQGSPFWELGIGRWESEESWRQRCFSWREKPGPSQRSPTIYARGRVCFVGRTSSRGTTTR